MSQRKKVLVIGLDCVEPTLVFEQWRDELPHFKRVMDGGVWGRLESCTPAITVPAWSSMMSSRDPGVLGFYGFRNRGDYSYEKQTLANANSVKVDRVWDILSRAGKKVITIGVPQTYPPKPVNGIQVGCFLSPSTTNPERPYTYPASAMQEIASLVGEYLVDVPNFRTNDKDFLLRQIYTMTEKRFKLVKRWIAEKDWDFFMFVEMGTDRIHHGLWKYHDPGHPRHEAHPVYSQSIHDYYLYLDNEIGQILELVDDDTTVFIVSDHGAKKMDGGICVNEWLMCEGYLTLKNKPEQRTSIDTCGIDWSRTKVWGDGGYYARIFLNVEGREPQGIVNPGEVEALRDELKTKLEAIVDPHGVNIGTKVFKPQEIYQQCNGFPPDLIVYFGDLFWRSVGTVGYDSIYTFENDTGPDDCNHAQYGMVIKRDPALNQGPGGRELSGLQLMDMAPTILQHLEVPIPMDMQGKPF
ncbi:MAG TPA: alkaline phosphatase family protein [Ktedonosporobacter sp.]|jgi:predicted AlkP superfamily phosphohydrolase/phosphomutase|nr:alkaline phosphatase family protein [Ktedonosporobacter sp.]